MKKRMGEFELIAELTRGLPASGTDLFTGVGDDCAVISAGDGRDWLVTTDALVEKVHFCREWCDLKTLGRKALAVNFSDIAAMGGTPRFYTVTLGLPSDFGSRHALELYGGMKEYAGRTGAAMIGGDTVSCPHGVFISITAIGEIKHGRAILRSTAEADDVVYVTGALGHAALGLRCLKKKRTDGIFKCYVDRILDPVARIEMGRWLEKTGLVNSMIDVSDGLLSDIGHIADASGVGFEIEAEDMPLDAEFCRACGEFGQDPLELALTGGEDYELLFTVGAPREVEFQKLIEGAGFDTPVAKVGTLCGDSGKRAVMGEDGEQLRFDRKGYDHFAGCDE